jgi:hypothetical protein
LSLDTAMRRSLVADAGGARRDAVLCLAQAAGASKRVRFGLPERIDPVEGWIVAE